MAGRRSPRTRHGERGQSFVETAVALPAMLIALTYLFWSMKYGVIAERMESLGRYSNAMLPYKTQYGRYSMLALYSAALEKPTANTACSVPPPSWLGENGVAQVNGVSFPRGLLWSEHVTGGWCQSGHLGFVDAAFTREYILSFNRSGASATFRPPILGSIYDARTATTVASHEGNAFDAAGVNTVLTCFPDLLLATQASLVGAASPGSDSTAPFAAGAAHDGDAPPEQPLASDPACHNEVVESSQ